MEQWYGKFLVFLSINLSLSFLITLRHMISSHSNRSHRYDDKFCYVGTKSLSNKDHDRHFTINFPSRTHILTISISHVEFIILGFDCSSPRVCCGTETDRYCCISSTLSSSSQTPSQPSDDFIFHPSNTFLAEKWFLIQICIIGIFLAISLLIFVLLCQCITSIRRNRRRQTMSIAQIPLPAASPLLIEHNRSALNRISTISHTPSDVKSMILNTPLNIYPTTNSRNSTSTSSSYYMFPNELEHLCN
jgi:hypothetical protein